jgi:hypothetical protein
MVMYRRKTTVRISIARKTPGYQPDIAAAIAQTVPIPSAPPTMSSWRIRPPAKIPKSRITESTKLHRDDRERVTRDEGQHIAIKNEQHRVSMPYFERQKAMYSCCRVFHNSSRLPELVVGIMGALENRYDARAVESGGDGLVGLAAQFLDHFAA